MTKEEFYALIEKGGGVNKAKIVLAGKNYYGVFIPTHIGNHCFIAMTENGKVELPFFISLGWELYEKPKKKIKIAPYDFVFVNKELGEDSETIEYGYTKLLYRDDNEFLSCVSGNTYKVEKYKRRTDLEIEIEVDNG